MVKGGDNGGFFHYERGDGHDVGVGEGGLTGGISYKSPGSIITKKGVRGEEALADTKPQGDFFVRLFSFLLFSR